MNDPKPEEEILEEALFEEIDKSAVPPVISMSSAPIRSPKRSAKKSRR